MAEDGLQITPEQTQMAATMSGVGAAVELHAWGVSHILYLYQPPDLTRVKRRYCAGGHFWRSGMTISAISTTVWNGLTTDTYEVIDRAVGLVQRQS